MTEPRKTVVIEVRTLWMSLAAVAVLLGCAVTSITILVTQHRKKRDADAVATDAPRRERLAPSARVPPRIVVAPTTPPRSTPPMPTIPTGRFLFAPESMFDARFEPFRSLFVDGRLSRTVEAVNVYALEHDVTIKTNQKDGCVPGYEPATHEITLCVAETAAIYERARSVMGEDTPLDDSDASKAASDALAFRTLHGMGEALASDLQLAHVTLERAGDEFATLVLVQNGRAQACLEGMAATLDPSGRGADTQRLDRVVCLALGGDPTLVGLDSSFDSSKCGDEYRRVDDLWTKLLSPFTRPQTSRAP